MRDIRLIIYAKYQHFYRRNEDTEINCYYFTCIITDMLTLLSMCIQNNYTLSNFFF